MGKPSPDVVKRSSSSERIKIAIVGAYPPPIGGNSVHVQRLAEECRSRRLDCQVADFYWQETYQVPEWVYRPSGSLPVRLAKACIWLAGNRFDVVHFHVSAMGRFAAAGWPLLAASAFARRRLLTIHSGSFTSAMTSGGPAQRMVISRLLRGFHDLVVVNPEQREYLIDHLQADPHRVHVIPAFIPPRRTGPMGASSGQKTDTGVRTKLVTSGRATETYGHLLFLSAVRKLEKLGLHLDVAVVLYGKSDPGYYQKVRNAAQILSGVSLVENLDPEQFNQLLSESDIYVRSTLTDGDSISVREALAAGCRVVASDCVKRPSGTSLFETGSLDALVQGIQESVVARPRSAASDDEGFLDRILSLYRV